MYGLYIHIPFCLKKCRYCDFVSFTGMQDTFDNYIKALSEEMSEYLGETADSVFIGGGTPTAFSANQLERLLEAVKKNFKLTSDAEVSIEANPKTIDHDKLSVLKAGGINRISIGVQSFIDKELSFLGRVHSAYEAEEAVMLASEYIKNINIDLMFAVPGQTVGGVEYSVKRATELGAEHISCYSLILEEGTELFREYEEGRLTPVDDEVDRNIFEHICNFLRESGYNRYEISNFAKTGRECRHNLKYWDCEEYIGVGVSAHSYMGGERFYNTSDVRKYILGEYEEERIRLTSKDKMSEFMIMGFRKICGISLAEFYNKFGEDAYNVFDIERFEKAGLIVRHGERIALSRRGLDVSNSILCEFV